MAFLGILAVRKRSKLPERETAQFFYRIRVFTHRSSKVWIFAVFNWVFVKFKFDGFRFFPFFIFLFELTL